MSDKDKNQQETSEQELNKDEQKPKGKEPPGADKKDPHRGITNTPPQDKEMMPGGQDPDEGYLDDDGELDEELEDLEDEEG